MNERVIENPSIKLKEEGTIKIEIPKPRAYSLTPQNIKIKVIYEDEHLIVIDKEAGMIVHPGSGNFENTLVNAVLYHCKDNLSGIGGVLRPGVVHRIDKMTSGLIVLAKNDLTHNSLSEQFKLKTTFREYDLLVWNSLPKDNDEINTKISRSKLNRKKMAVTKKDNGKIAITRYKKIKSYILNEKITISQLKCQLLTGRTHQIRLHMSFIGNPLIGDKKYSRNNYYLKLPDSLKSIIYEKFVMLERHTLHATKLGFKHPHTNKKLLFHSNLPKDFNMLIKKLDLFMNDYE